jgi:hypothetical protein
MLRSVKLDDDFGAVASKIRDVPANRRLPAKMKTVTLHRAQHTPHPTLAIRRCFPQLPRASNRHSRPDSIASSRCVDMAIVCPLERSAPLIPHPKRLAA